MPRVELQLLLCYGSHGYGPDSSKQWTVTPGNGLISLSLFNSALGTSPDET